MKKKGGKKTPSWDPAGLLKPQKTNCSLSLQPGGRKVYGEVGKKNENSKEGKGMILNLKTLERKKAEGSGASWKKINPGKGQDFRKGEPKRVHCVENGENTKVG